MPIINSVAMRSILTELIDTGNVLDAVELRLWSNDINPSITDNWATYVEATFSGYAMFTPVVWGAAFTDVDGVSKVAGGCHQFTQSAITVTGTVYGWAITQGTSPVVLIAAERLTTPVVMDAIGRAVIVHPTVPLVTPGQ